MRYRHEAVVVGRVRFPLDMLRYEQCWPATDQDAVAIDASFSGCTDGDVTVNVRAESTDRDHWTPDRWKSFGWILCNSNVEKIRRG